MSTWYKAGTIDVTNGSTAVIGTGTDWIRNAKVGDELKAPDGRGYEITGVTAAGAMSIDPAYLGPTQAGAEYKIKPTRGVTQEFLKAASDLLSEIQPAQTGPLSGLFKSGSATEPGIAFTEDPDTGFWLEAVGVLSAVTEGVRRMKLNSTALQLDVPLTGAAVQSAPDDRTAGRVALADHVHTLDQITGFDPAAFATAAQGALANTALQPGEAATPGQGALADTSLQPGEAATPAQGVLAETALQPGEAATPAQGLKADTALQPGDVIEGETVRTRMRAPGGDYTLEASDNNRNIEMWGNADGDLTVADVLDIGDRVFVYRSFGTGTKRIVPGTDVNINESTSPITLSGNHTGGWLIHIGGGATKRFHFVTSP